MSVPRRIAQIICTDAFAGAERYVVTLATGLSAAGCEVVVIGGSGDRMRPLLADASSCRWVPGTTVATAARAVVSARPFDVVHAHMTAAETAAVLTAPLVGAPVVATRHFAQRRGRSLGGRLARRGLERAIAAELTISDFVAGRTEVPGTVVYPGVEDAEGTGPPSREPLVVMAQRLEEEKETMIGIEAWSRCGLPERGWRLVVAGEGSERLRLEARCRELGVEGSCDFLGAVSDVRALFRRCSIMLAPRSDEPFGLSVVEAMAEAVPVVAAGGGGHLETVGVLEGAALFAPGDADGAAAQLRALGADTARRRDYGLGLQQLQQRAFSPARLVERTLAVYEELSGTRRRGRGRSSPLRRP